ncbi:hypothetical protein AVEN_220532-1 [Araneus ventricosus]|uniref:Uncharacterized protein n=1 Tax=Araneus ventricosus TaxID=182803 RepID=A0A4Y2SJ40_ARAVE|nr:hypothetical protein AVEN_220532-1 [Araneus ventricosus]
MNFSSLFPTTNSKNLKSPTKRLLLELWWLLEIFLGVEILQGYHLQKAHCNFQTNFVQTWEVQFLRFRSDCWALKLTTTLFYSICTNNWFVFHLFQSIDLGKSFTDVPKLEKFQSPRLTATYFPLPKALHTHTGDLSPSRRSIFHFYD